MKETKVYVVKAPQGDYEDYQEPIVKVFLDKKKAKAYIKEENAKLPLEQAKKCNMCCYKWECVGQKGKETPSCFKGDKYNYCENYFKYHDTQELFIEEHEIEDIKTHDREVVKEVCEKIRRKVDNISMHTATKERLMIMCEEIQQEFEDERF